MPKRVKSKRANECRICARNAQLPYLINQTLRNMQQLIRGCRSAYVSTEYKVAERLRKNSSILSNTLIRNVKIIILLFYRYLNVYKIKILSSSYVIKFK